MRRDRKTWWALAFWALPLFVWAQPKKSSNNSSGGPEDWQEKTQFYVGMGLEVIEVHDRRDGLPYFVPQPTVWSINFGGNYVFLHGNDFMSLSANPNIHFALGWRNGLNFMFQAPMFLLGRIGAGCTNFNQQKVGAGVGLGFNYTYFGSPYLSSTGIPSRMSLNFVAPAACAEVTFRFRSGPFTFRVHANLLPFNDEIVNGFERVPVRYMNYGFCMLWYFNSLFD